MMFLWLCNGSIAVAFILELDTHKEGEWKGHPWKHNINVLETSS
jgi:hypothetical protein